MESAEVKTIYSRQGVSTPKRNETAGLCLIPLLKTALLHLPDLVMR
jgi:hypothetical protein